MKNCLILGTGRSGTSLMGGILHEAGYYMGDNLYPPRDSNPKGFFECDYINGINEEILKPYDFLKNSEYVLSKHKKYSPLNLAYGYRWLAYIHPTTNINMLNSEIKNKIINVLKKEPFAFKDPRFNFTISVWLRYANKSKTVIICVFREPWNTIQSILKECTNADYLSSFYIDYFWAEKIWINNYKKILINKDNYETKIMFVHYKQLLSGIILPKISSFIEASLSNDFVSTELNRTKCDVKVSDEAFEIYCELCKLANFNE